MTAQDFLGYYSGIFKRKLKFSYPIAWAKHSAMFSRLKNFYNDREILNLIYYYFKQNNDEVMSCGYSIEHFISYIPKLCVILKNTRNKEIKVHSDYYKLEPFRDETK